MCDTHESFVNYSRILGKRMKYRDGVYHRRDNNGLPLIHISSNFIRKGAHGMSQLFYGC